MRGTEFVIAEIIWWMVAAAALGALIGWLLRGWRNARIDAEWLVLVTSLRDRIARLESADEGGDEPGADGDATPDAGDGEDLDVRYTIDAAEAEPEPDVEVDPEPEPDVEVEPSPEPDADVEPSPEPDADVEPTPEPEIELVGTPAEEPSVDATALVSDEDPNADDPELVVDLEAVGPADPYADGETADSHEDELDNS